MLASPCPCGAASLGTYISSASREVLYPWSWPAPALPRTAATPWAPSPTGTCPTRPCSSQAFLRLACHACRVREHLPTQAILALAMEQNTGILFFTKDEIPVDQLFDCGNPSPGVCSECEGSRSPTLAPFSALSCSVVAGGSGVDSLLLRADSFLARYAVAVSEVTRPPMPNINLHTKQLG